MKRNGVLFLSLCWVAKLMSAEVPSGTSRDPRTLSFALSQENSLGDFGGVPFCTDLNGDGKAEVLWLQSPGMFHSKVFDKPPWKGQFSDEERNLFCLTATDARGNVLWQVGRPWSGKRPFVSHSAERAVDWADIDGDGAIEVVCVRGYELMVIDGRTGKIERSVKTPADNAQIVRVAHTGKGPKDWTILAKNAESAYKPHQYANPAWFYDADLRLIKTADYLGAGHAPQVFDVDRDGLDEFLIGYNLIDHDLTTKWTYWPVPKAKWDAGEMHVDYMVVGRILHGDVIRTCVALAASNKAYLLDACTGELIWERTGTHPQNCRIGRFLPAKPEAERQVLVYNKRADFQLYDVGGKELWRMTPPENFPAGQAAPCRRQKFHVFDATTMLPGRGPGSTDLFIFTDGGWPYVIDGAGRRCAEFPHTPNIAQDWGEVPGRPDDYGYGFYARVADVDGDKEVEVLLNDRRFVWIYEIR